MLLALVLWVLAGNLFYHSVKSGGWAYSENNWVVFGSAFATAFATVAAIVVFLVVLTEQ